MNSENFSAGVMSALMTCTGGAILIIHTAQVMGLSQAALISWILMAYVAGGLMNLFLALRYKTPIAGAHSITTAAFLSTAAAHLTLPELAGSVLIGGAFIVLLGITGVFNKLFQLIPRPVIEAMLAGLLLQYVLNIVPSFKAAPIVGTLAVIGFFVTPKISKSLPPLLGVLVFGVVGLLLTYKFPEIQHASFYLPQWVTPQVEAQHILSFALPIAVLILSNDLAVAMASLTKNGFKTNVNKALIYSGLGTMFASLFGGHSINIGGMMTTLCSSDEAGNRDKRYLAGVVSSVSVIIFGLVAWSILGFITAMPSYFFSLLTGFSLLGILLGSLRSAFSQQGYSYSVIFAFIISASQISFLSVSSAIWSLLIGSVLAKILKENKKAEELQTSKA